MQSITLRSPAKLNLYLKVLDRRPDGYHNLYTLFHRISFSDVIRLRKSNSFRLYCSNPDLSTDERNLVTRAYNLLRKKFPNLGGVTAHLKKNIPLGSGLGGGSSNAATFLLGMNRLYGLKLSRKELVSLGEKLGADVPFFLYEVNQAVGTGRGDKIVPAVAKRRQWFLLILSGKGVSTKKVFQSLPRRIPAVSLTKIDRTVRLLRNFLEGRKFGRAADLLLNDLEPPTFRLRPSLQKMIADFNKLGITTARMSGSGPTLYAILSHQREARRFAQKLQQKQPSKNIIVCHSL